MRCRLSRISTICLLVLVHSGKFSILFSASADIGVNIKQERSNIAMNLFMCALSCMNSIEKYYAICSDYSLYIS